MILESSVKVLNFQLIPKLSDLSIAKKRFTQVNPDL